MKSWQIEDISEWAKENKYTFYIPPKSVIDKLEKGKLARLIFVFESDRPEAPRAERMWVEIKERVGDKFKGYLTNMPLFIEDLLIGAEIEFETKNIIDSDVKSEEEDLVVRYIHRCFVTNEVSKKKRKIKYLYREESLGEQRDGIFDSGWRITAGDETQEYMDDNKNIQILSLGFVLNIDDTILGILDEPVGSQFEWDDSRNEFRKIMES